MKLSNPSAPVTVFNDPIKFWNEVAPELKNEEAKNSLCLGLSYIFQTDPKDCIYQSASRGKRGLLAALVCSQYRTNRNFVPTPVEDVSHAKKLFAEFAKTNLPVNGVVGEVNTANIYKELLEKSGKCTKVHMTQGIYRCKKVLMPEMSPNLKFRVAELTDVEKVGKWIEAFHQEAVPHDPPVNGRALAEVKINKNQVCVLEQNGELVSMAGWSRDIETSCSVNLVYTPKQSRKNGFGSIVTAHLTQHFLDNGKHETNLYTDMTNPTSNKIYQNIGYEFICNSVHLGVF